MKNMKEKELIEKLADYEHDRWSKWQTYLFSKCLKSKEGELIIPKEYVERWTRQMNTSFRDLTDQEQESDRKEARKILEIIKKK